MPNTSEGDPATGVQPDPLTGFDLPMIRTEAAIVRALDAVDDISRQPLGGLDPVEHAVRAARLSLVEALRRCGRGESTGGPMSSPPWK